MATMGYKGYIARIEYDEGDEIFHGRIANISDIVTFEGKTVKELQREFERSVEEYFKFCAEQGEGPERPFSGTLSLRVGSEVHRAMHLAAERSGKTLNGWARETLLEAAERVIA